MANSKSSAAASRRADSRKTAEAPTDRQAPGNLLSGLMKLALTTAGAHTAVLLLKSGDHLLIEAIATAGIERVTVNQSIPLATLAAVENQCLLLPLSLINAVARARTGTLLSDARGAHRFASDPYITFRQPRSILCEPLCRRRRLIGVLYLENHAAHAAFRVSDAEAVKAFGRLAVERLTAAQLC